MNYATHYQIPLVKRSLNQLRLNRKLVKIGYMNRIYLFRSIRAHFIQIPRKLCKDRKYISFKLHTYTTLIYYVRIQSKTLNSSASPYTTIMKQSYSSTSSHIFNTILESHVNFKMQTCEREHFFRRLAH